MAKLLYGLFFFSMPSTFQEGQTSILIRYKLKIQILWREYNEKYNQHKYNRDGRSSFDLTVAFDVLFVCFSETHALL